MGKKRHKFRKAMKATGLILKNPVLLNRVLSEPDVWKDYVFKNHDREKGLPVIHMDQVFDGEVYDVGPITFLDGGSLPTDLALLRGLAGFFKDCKYFEIGTWRGESVANMARVAAECYTLNLSAEEMRRMGVRSKYMYLLGYFSRALENVVHLSGNSLEFDFAALDKKFDIIFIDGDHHYEHVRNDTEKAIAHLAHKDSVIVWHDYAYHPEEVRFEVLAGILDGTDPSLHEDLYHVSQTKCAILLKKDLKGKFLDPPEEPDEFYEVKMNRKTIPPKK